MVVHPEGDVADAGPGVEPRAEQPESAIVGGRGESGEAERRQQETPALVSQLSASRIRPRGQLRVWPTVALQSSCIAAPAWTLLAHPQKESVVEAASPPQRR